MNGRRARLSLSGLFVVAVLGAVAAWRLGADDGGAAATRESVQAVRGPADERAPRRRVLVTRDDRQLQAGCRPRQVGLLVISFFAAINRGSPRAASFVDFESDLPPSSPSYSVTVDLGRGPSRHFVTTTPETLSRYLAARHRRHERLALRELKVRETSSGLGQVEYRLRRSADDLRRRGVRLHGKGAIACEDRKIVLWATGNDEEGRPARERPPLCPRPRRETSLPIVCSRRDRA